MPSFDAGYYQLTSLIPLRQDLENRAVWDWRVGPGSRQVGQSTGSVADSLRELLSSFRSVDVPNLDHHSAVRGRPGRPIPFSANSRTHFARFVVVESLAYNGRQNGDTLIDMARDLLRSYLPSSLRLSDFDRPDYLPVSYLLVLIDFDSPDGSRESVERYLVDLWSSMQNEWIAILNHCRDFVQSKDRQVASYLDLILRHEVETVFPYAIYRWGADRANRWQPSLGRFSSRGSGNRTGLLVGCIGVPILELALALLLFMFCGPSLLVDPWFVGFALFALAMKPIVLQHFLRRANEPWSAASGADLQSVLKALFLQSSFLEMVERSQERFSQDSPSLLAYFRQYVEANRPNDLHGPTLRAGAIPRYQQNSPDRTRASS